MRLIRRLKYIAAFALLSLVALPTMAASQLKKTLKFYVSYEITLASDGSIEKLMLRDKKLSPLMTDFLEKSIRSWKFTPGSIQGVPQRTESALWLNVQAMPREDGNYELQILDANTGLLGASVLTPPRYPKNELIRGQEAVLSLLVSYDENGFVTNVERTDVLSTREEKLMKPFELASFSERKNGALTRKKSVVAA